MSTPHIPQNRENPRHTKLVVPKVDFPRFTILQMSPP